MNPTDNGLVHVPSPRSVVESLQKLEAVVEALGLMVFARVDHSGEAEKVGLQMRPTKVLILGSPKAGTPLMIASPTLAIDLPLKVLIWEDEQGKVWLSYNSPEYLMHRHNVPESLIKNIAGIGTVVQKAVE